MNDVNLPNRVVEQTYHVSLEGNEIAFLFAGMTIALGLVVWLLVKNKTN